MSVKMGIGINTHETDYGEIQGFQEAVACSAWFTSTGAVMPKMIKYKDDNGVIQPLYNIHVHNCEKRNYCGIPTFYYDCEVIVGSRCYPFQLLYYTERQEWKILWKNRKDDEKCVDDTI